ncbi:MAG: hypothetical protein J6R99_00685 [Alphaproteobacteria bacterium]|nr:hypothetical protein [Alphaproteobacteria bacterium]
MKIAMSYLVELENGKVAWLAVGKSAENAKIIEERPMLIPEFGKVLRHKTTGEESSGHWLRDDSADNWEEIEEPKEQGAE